MLQWFQAIGYLELYTIYIERKRNITFAYQMEFCPIVSC